MRHTPFILALLTCTLFSCTKETPAPIPESAFTVSEFGGFGITYTDSVFFVGTHDAFVFRNLSAMAKSVQWDFGNGLISSVNDTVLSFDKPGEYNVVLSAFNSDGVKKISTRKFTVFERVLKSFSIDRFEMNMFAPSQNNLPVFSKMDLWMELKLSDTAAFNYTSNGDFVMPVVYKSPVFKDVDSSFHGSFNFTVTDKVVVNYPVNNVAFPGNTGPGFIINLYGQDGSGIYLLSSSRWSGIGISFLNVINLPVVKNYSMQTWVAGSPTSVTINCTYQ